MVQGYEIIALILGLIALVVFLLNWKRLQTLPAKILLISGFFLFLSSWVFTNAEAFFWKDTLNLLEHVSQASGGILVATWCWEVFKKTEEEIMLEARIVAVADAWDAMRTDRPYREALPEEVALQELRENAGSQFDPKIVEILLKLIKKEGFE